MYYFKSLVCALAIAGVPAGAATITANSVVNLSSESSLVDTADGPTSTSESQTFISDRDDLDPNDPADNRPADLLAAAASADIESGALKARVETDGVGAASPRENVAASSSFRETITASGNGTVTFTLAYDGFWDVARVSGQQFALFGASAQLAIEEGQPLDPNDPRRTGVDLANNRDNPWTGSTAGSISVTTTVNGTKSFDVFASLFAGIGSGNGVMDFSNTGILDFFTTGTVDVSFADIRFLTGGSTTPVSPVPLPAGLPLLATALGLFGLARTRRARSAC